MGMTVRVEKFQEDNLSHPTWSPDPYWRIVIEGAEYKLVSEDKRVTEEKVHEILDQLHQDMDDYVDPGIDK